jgi:hypothetical protein
VQHRLAGRPERRQRGTLVERDALLVDREVELVHQLRRLFQVVLQGYREPSFVGEPGDEPVERQLVRGGDREPGPSAVVLHDVGLHRVEALVAAHVEPCGEHTADQVEAPDVEPALARPVGRQPEHRCRPPPEVGPELRRGAHLDVADHPPAAVVQRPYRIGAVLEAVDVEHLGVDGRVDRRGELPLPGHPRLRHPPLRGVGHRVRVGGDEREQRRRQQAEDQPPVHRDAHRRAWRSK